MEPIKIKGLIIGTALGSGMTYLFSKKRINKIREIINSKKQNEFGKRNYIDLNISNNKAEEKNEEKVISSYVLMNKLKDVVRTGWKDWNVEKERVESIAEHVYGVQQLALIMYLTYKEEYKDLNLNKVILMLAIHETEEIIIGDKTLFEMSKEEKEELGHKAIEIVLAPLANKDKLRELILEFDERKTPEAKFAFFCDKLECDLQSTVYDNENCVNLNNQDGNIAFNDKTVQSLLGEGKSFSEMWLLFSQGRYSYDKNFTTVSNYALEHNAKKLVRRKETENK